MALLPWQRAKKWHTESGSTASFEEVLGMFMREGYVWSSPAEFVLAKQARWEDGELYVGAVSSNCWFVHLAAADGLGGNPFKRFLELAPYPLPFVAWQRHGLKRYHVYKWDKFKTKLEDKYGNKSFSTGP